MQKENDITNIQHELVEMQKGQPFLLLHANGDPCICPFQPVIPAQGSNGQMQANRSVCNTGCPHARLRVDKGGGEDPGDTYIFSITCSGYSADRTVTIRRATTITPVPSIVRP